jgi:hypothetical protein
MDFFFFFLRSFQDYKSSLERVMMSTSDSHASSIYFLNLAVRSFGGVLVRVRCDDTGTPLRDHLDPAQDEGTGGQDVPAGETTRDEMSTTFSMKDEASQYRKWMQDSFFFSFPIHVAHEQ